MKGVGAAVLIVVAGCSSNPCAQVCETETVGATDTISWELTVFHVVVCAGSTCDTVDVPRGGPAVHLPTVGGSTSIAPASHESTIDVELDDGVREDGTTPLTTGEPIHVVATEPGTGVIVCDMTAPVIDAPPSTCGCPRHALGPFVEHY